MHKYELSVSIITSRIICCPTLLAHPPPLSAPTVASTPNARDIDSQGGGVWRNYLPTLLTPSRLRVPPGGESVTACPTNAVIFLLCSKAPSSEPFPGLENVPSSACEWPPL